MQQRNAHQRLSYYLFEHHRLAEMRFVAERSRSSILRFRLVTTCMNNEVSRKVSVGGGLTIHERPVIAYAGALHEPVRPRRQPVDPSRTSLPPVPAGMGAFRIQQIFWCARISPALSAGEIPAPEREEPPHRESSLGLMKATT